MQGLNRMVTLAENQYPLVAMQKQISDAETIAKVASNDIQAHEKLCAERYGNIEKSFTRIDAHIPVIYTKLDRITTLVYIGVGIWIGVPGVLGMIYGFYRIIVR